jgi:hypothetical protein
MSDKDDFESLKEMLEQFSTNFPNAESDTVEIDIGDYVVDDADWIFDASGLTAPTITIGDNFSMNTNNSLEVDGNITCKDKDGNVINVGDTLSAIKDRLAILQPDPKKLEQWEALREAYEHYKSLEALIGQEENNGD